MIGLLGAFEGHQQIFCRNICMSPRGMWSLTWWRAGSASLCAIETWQVTVKSWKPKRFGHVTHQYNSLSKRKSFLTSWRTGITGVGRGNPGHAVSRSGCCCPCQKCLQQLLTEKTHIICSASKVYPDASLKTNNACISNIVGLQSPPRRKP